MNLLRFFRWHVLRYVGRHPLLASINVLSAALGVAVFLAVQLANQSANRAFAATIDLVAGKAQLEVLALANDLPDETFGIIRKTAGVAAATPLVRGIVTLPDFPGEYLDVLGIDIFTNTPFRTFALTNFAARDFDIEEWLRGPNAIAVSAAFAKQHRLNRGDAIRAQINGQEHLLRVVFTIEASEAGDLDRHFSAIDIGWAQELFGLQGKLTSVQLRIDPAQERDELVARLRAQLPPNLEVGAPARRSQQVDKMLSSFQLNLAAMSLVSVFVGAFLIFNTISASTVRRRREIGILRTLGISRFQVGAMFIGEAMASAAIGTLLGLVLGTWLARYLVEAVSKTISSLYVLLSVSRVAASGWTYAEAAALGMFSALLASVLPACAAAKMSPVGALHPQLTDSTHEHSVWRWLSLSAVALLGAVAASVIALRIGPATSSFLAAFLCLAAGSCLAPPLTLALAKLVSKALRGKKMLPAQLAVLNLRRSLSRNAITIAALASAIAMAVGVAAMIFSFRQTVNAWINQTLVADVFVTPASNEIAGPSAYLAPEILEFFQKHPSVLAVDTFRYVEVPFRGSRMSLAGIRAEGPRTFSFLAGNDAHLMQVFRQERCVIVSETFARRQQVRVGGSLEIATARGEVLLPVTAIFYDYSRDDGIVFTNATNFVQLFRDERVNSVGVYLRKGAAAENLTAAFQKQFNGRGEFAIYSNRALRQRVFEVFDQTFAITYVLRAIAMIVAIAGIFLSFSTLIIERSRVLGITRALGISRPQLASMILWESIFISFVASILGIASGIMLSVILTEVVNRAFFGWTIKLQIPIAMVAITPVWILIAAVLAAVLPSIRASRLNLAEALREE